MLATGTPVVNGVAHAYNLSAENARGAAGEGVRQAFYGIHAHFNPFDFLVYHVLRLDSLFSDGLCGLGKAVELQARWPDRTFVYCGLGPTLGLQRCLDDLDAQLEVLPRAVGVKLYPDQVQPYRTFRMDDPQLMFPLYERMLERGLRVVAVHKALPNGPVPLGPYRIDDVEGAAMRFPRLNFEIVHAGMAFVPETAYALGRFPNVYANLEITTMLLRKAPRLFAEAFAELLFRGGPDKLIYSDGALFAHPRIGLDDTAAYQLPEDLQDKWGLPPLDDAFRAKILGANWARMAGVDLAERTAAVADDEVARRRTGGLRRPFEAWRELVGVDVPTPAPRPSRSTVDSGMPALGW
ncbi:amidohydrolase family protein [Micromonospora marina]|uniref:amidohydrolase family protein n=1 Tax=Micromonospora marina TaxID=307120 RepID=UPI0034562F48